MNDSGQFSNTDFIPRLFLSVSDRSFLLAAFLFAINPQVKIYLHTEAEQVWLLSPIQHAFLPLADGNKAGQFVEEWIS
ncbi:MAG: hypothetical protein NTY42_10680 [Planctomycetota bacterium]|nr:hypothetical protein [Planctomycetota bacterium]